MKKLFVAFAAILLFISCQNSLDSKNEVSQLRKDLKNEEKPIAVDDERNKHPVDIGVNAATTDKEEPEKTKQAQQIPPPKIDWDKKIIKNANLNIEVKDYTAYNTSLRGKIKQFGGYIAQEEQSQSEYKIENILTIKVPADQFDDAVNNISSNVKELNGKKITSQDVTTEYIDTRSRMETKRQVRQRYLDLLKQARNMEEILNVQSVVNGVQEEIESAAGRLEYLSHASSYSTITLTFYQVINEKAIDNDKPSFAARVGNAFRSGWEWIGELSVAIVSIWPLLLFFFAVFVFYKRSKRPTVKQV